MYRLGGSPEVIQGVNRGWWERRTAYFKRHFSPAEGVVVIRPESLLCGIETCFAGQNGKAFYFDDDHLSVEGARKVAELIANAINTPKP
ncbi:hypothetical protein HSBAA_00270 [Vreelandella sulfidaeris]|uniref:SGNH domain-containing protein n=1 Tax=Vreelandella sulfidaeris TaxID=115553 RepID=A0A455U2K8_9GAMM|nr:hypothetical protein HSBAA_00270 [Halomonas sulfidaeris]